MENRKPGTLLPGFLVYLGMIKLKVKPLSVNECWQGKKFKTNKYLAYEKLLLAILPTIKVPSGRLQITYNFGFSSPLSDADNPS